MSLDPSGRLPRAFTTPGTSSFLEFLASYSPALLPGNRILPAGNAPVAPHATTTIITARPAMDL